MGWGPPPLTQTPPLESFRCVWVFPILDARLRLCNNIESNYFLTISWEGAPGGFPSFRFIEYVCGSGVSYVLSIWNDGKPKWPAIEVSYAGKAQSKLEFIEDFFDNNHTSDSLKYPSAFFALPYLHFRCHL